jgi:hypothetical protein
MADARCERQFSRIADCRVGHRTRIARSDRRAEEKMMIDKPMLKDSLGWGFILWLIGYVLGIILFFALPASVIGWIIMPIGILITLFVLLKRVQGGSFAYYLSLAVIWTFIAIALDYVFIVQALRPPDGYYKLDVYLYYIITFLLPITVGWSKTSNSAGKTAR